MAEEGQRRPAPLEPAAPWSKPEPGEPEPDWADDIRRGRKERGERLRDVFATFDDDDNNKETRPPV